MSNNATAMPAWMTIPGNVRKSFARGNIRAVLQEARKYNTPLSIPAILAGCHVMFPSWKPTKANISQHIYAMYHKNELVRTGAGYYKLAH
jgi:co-chaperonin GroES (HSP10)